MLHIFSPMIGLYEVEDSSKWKEALRAHKSKYKDCNLYSAIQLVISSRSVSVQAGPYALPTSPQTPLPRIYGRSAALAGAWRASHLRSSITPC